MEVQTVPAESAPWAGSCTQPRVWPPRTTVWPPRTNVWLRATEPAPRAKRPTSVCTLGHPRSADRGRAQSCRGHPAAPLPLWRGPTSGNPNESPSPYMQPTDLKAIARDAALRGDTKTLFHTLDLLERLLPIAAFMDFCTELTNSACRGSPHGRTETFGTSSIQQHFASAGRPGQLSQSQWLHGRQNQILAANNKRRTSTKPTNNQSAPSAPPRSADRGRVRLAGGFSSPFPL